MDSIENNKVIVSVIITTYKRPLNILMRAVESVINQTFRDLELIVINDNPDDPILSEAIQKKLFSASPTIKYVLLKKNSGACYARNYGLTMAKGEFVAFLDDDDEWLPEKIEKQIQKMKDGVAIVGCDSLRVIDGKEKYYHPKYDSNDYLGSILIGNFMGSTSFPLIRKKCIQEVSGFDINLGACQDYDLWIRLIQRYRCDFINDALVKYYISDDSTFKHNDDKYYSTLLNILMKYEKDRPKELSIALNNHAVNSLVYSHNIKYFIRYKSLAFSTNFFSPYNYFSSMFRIIKKFKSSGMINK